MKRKPLLFLLLIFVGLFWVVGCGDDNGGPTGGDVNAGSLGEHTEGPNENVTLENVEIVTREINEMAWRAFEEGQKNIVSKPALDISYNLDGDVPGLKNGKALVEGKITQKMSALNISGYEYDYNCTFYDFSDDGELFLGGSAYYNGSLKYSDNKISDYTVTIKAGIRFKGKYDGAEEFTTTVKMDDTGNYTFEGTTTVTSGGETFTYDYSY